MKKQKLYKLKIHTKSKVHERFVVAETKKEAINLFLNSELDNFILSNMNSIEIEELENTKKIINFLN